MKLFRECSALTSQFDVSQLQKQLRSVRQIHLDQCANFGPLPLTIGGHGTLQKYRSTGTRHFAKISTAVSVPVLSN